jgi:large subunit ribosomal protein L21
VEAGRYVTLNRLAVDEGEEVLFDRVLMVRGDDDVQVGAPLVDGALVKGTVRRHLRGPKIRGFIYRAKKGSSKRWGARADLTQVNITSIEVGGETLASAGVAAEVTESEEA